MSKVVVPKEQGKNRYGLDMSYFRNLINRELNRPLIDYPPADLARVFARASRTADADVLTEPEFSDVRELRAKNAELLAALVEAREYVYDWASCVDITSREKHTIDVGLIKIDAVIDRNSK